MRVVQSRSELVTNPKVYPVQAHAYYMRLPAYGAVAEAPEQRTRLAHEIVGTITQETRYVGATSLDRFLGNPTCEYGFMSLTAARAIIPGLAFELQKFAD